MYVSHQTLRKLGFRRNSDFDFRKGNSRCLVYIGDSQPRGYAVVIQRLIESGMRVINWWYSFTIPEGREEAECCEIIKRGTREGNRRTVGDMALELRALDGERGTESYE